MSRLVASIDPTKDMASKKTVTKKTPKKAVARKKAPKKAAPKKAAPKKAVARKKAPKKAAPKKAVARKRAPKKAAPKKAVARKRAPKKATPKKAVARKKAPKKALAKKGAVLAKKSAVSKAAKAKAAPKKRAPAKSSSVPKTQDNKLSKRTLPSAFLAKQKERLLEERAKYVDSADQLLEEAESLRKHRGQAEIQSADDSGEGDTTAYYMELDFAISAKARDVVEQIDAALARIKNGTYGICVDTGASIPRQRLEAIPWAAKTVGAKVGGLRH